MTRCFAFHLTRLVFGGALLLGLSVAAFAQVKTWPSDYRPASVLFYPKYTSNAAAPQLSDTQINITNTHQTQMVSLHLFAVDGSTCSVADSFISLTPNQTASVLISDFDPGVTGYLVAVAVNNGPAQFNFVIGDEFIRETDGRQANLQAIGVQKLTAGAVPVDPNGGGAQLNFNNIDYECLPSSIALSTFNSQLTDSTQVNVFVPSPNLMLGEAPATATRLFALVYDDTERVFSTNVSVVCYNTFLLGSLRVTGGLNNLVPAGRTGWIRFSSTARPLLGYVQNLGPVFNGGHNMHALALLNAYTIVVPSF